MSTRRPKFRWSDHQINNALLPYGIPTDGDEVVFRDLAEVGAAQILARREGGRKPTTQSARAEIRRIIISSIFEGQLDGYLGLLPARLRQKPTSPTTLRKVKQLLEQFGFTVEEGTVLKDVKKIGIRKLRGP